MTQNQWVAQRLLEDGRVTRNQALRNRITRLAARIRDLKEAGWEIMGNKYKTSRGEDYEYIFVCKL